MIMAFDNEKERILALTDFMQATETLFSGKVSDRDLALADGCYQRWRQRNRTGCFYWTTPDTESSTTVTGDPRPKNDAKGKAA